MIWIRKDVVARALREQSVNPMATASLKPTLLCAHAPFHRRLCAIFLAVLLLLFAGCGPRSDRLAVSGEVALDGAPLDEGSIRLTSTGNGKLFASGAMIKNGNFHVPQEKGLPPGTYRVEISSPDTAVPPVVYKGARANPCCRRPHPNGSHRNTIPRVSRPSRLPPMAIIILSLTSSAAALDKLPGYAV